MKILKYIVVAGFLIGVMLPLSAKAALSDSLVSYWKTDESSGNAADSVGSNTAVNTNVTYSAGKINNGAVFNGSSAKFTITDANNLDITGALTMGVWVNINNMTTGGEAILAKGDFNTGTSFTYGIDIGAGGDGLVRGIVSNGSTYNSTGNSSSIKDTNWHYITVVYIPSTSLTLYIDGSQVAQNTTSIISSIQSTAWNLFIGADGIGRNLPNTSKIDEPAIWNRELTSTEVTTLYNGGSGNQYPFVEPSSASTPLLGLVWSYIF